MSREIELKIPLFEEEFNFIYDFLCGKIFVKDIHLIDFCEKTFFTKKDEYYSKYKTESLRRKNNEPPVIRIRTNVIGGTEKSYFTIKHKTVENGIEINKEDETFIENAQVLRDFFALSGYFCWFSKEKKVCSAMCRFEKFPDIKFHLELEIVNNLKYVEIEVTDAKYSAKSIKSALNEFVQSLNLNPKNKDSRSWVQIILGK